MSTIAPGRPFNVTDAASFVALSQQNWVIASEELFRRLATYQNGAVFVCTVAGTPGTWRQISPATVNVDPASGTFPTGYLILNVTDDALKRHAGSRSLEAQVGAGARPQRSASTARHPPSSGPTRIRPRPPTSPVSSPSPTS